MSHNPTICSTPFCPPGEAEYIKPSRGPVRRYKEHPEHRDNIRMYCCDGVAEWAITVPHEAHNLLGNPTFKNNLWGWKANNAKISRTNEFSFSDGFAMTIGGSGDYQTTDRNAYVEYEIPISEIAKGQPYTFSKYLYLSELFDIADPNLGRISIVDQVGLAPAATPDFQEVFSPKLDVAGRWKRLQVTKNIRANADKVFVRVWYRSIPQTDSQPPTPTPTGRFNLPNEPLLYADMGQFEFGLEPTLPFHGDTQECGLSDKCCEGYKWLGVPHKSTSHRPKCARNGRIKSLCDFGLELVSHTGHSAPAVRDIATSYANRIGESYQKTAIDGRDLTFVAYNCDRNLEGLECEIFGLQDAIMPNIGQCSGEFMLIYRHKDNECIAGCETEKVRAICVRYVGGLESATRDSPVRQNVVLQFRAAQPAFFDYPGHISHNIPFEHVIVSGRVIKLHGDGRSQGFPIANGRNITAVGCLPGTDRIVFGGDFPDGINPPVDCQPNLALVDCGNLCQTGGLFGGPVNDIEPDGTGNLLIGGGFGGFLQILYGDTGRLGFFEGYTGGPVLSIATTPWAQVIVGTATGIHILVDTVNDATRGWRDYVTNGPVYDIAVEPDGNFIVVGDFTTIAGAGTPTVPSTNINNVNRIARFSVTHNGGCVDISRPEWRSLNYGFDAAVRAVEIDQNNGNIFVGGDFNNAVPDGQNICTLFEDTTTSSRGGNQEIIFTSLGGTQYRVELRLTNPVAAQVINNCMQNPPQNSNTAYVRVTGTSGSGSTYNLVLTGVPVIGAAAPLTTMQFTIDTATALPPQCANENSVFVKELSDSNRDVALFAGVPLTNGQGNDNTINTFTLQCLGLQTTYNGNNVPVSRVAQIVGGSVSPLGEGLSANVRALMIHGQSGDLWAGTVGAPTGFNDGLIIWNGQSWNNFPGNLSGRGPVGVTDLKYCPDDCSVLIASDRDGGTKIYGSAEIDYPGNFENMDAQVVVHGPGNLNHIGHHPCAKMANLCTVLQCDEVGTLNVGNAQLTSNHKRSLNSSILPGSRLDFWLKKCDQRMSVYVDKAEATTKATLLYRPHYWGLEGLCCVKTTQKPKKNICCNTRNLIQGRTPTEDDCQDQGWKTGDMWLDAFGCNQLFVLGDDKCCDTSTNGLMAGGVPITVPTSQTDPTPVSLCPQPVVCPVPNPPSCPPMTVAYVPPAGGNTQQNSLTGLQPATFDFPVAMNQTTVNYTFVLLVNLSPILVTANWVSPTRLTLTPTQPWPNGAKQVTFHQNAISLDGNCSITENVVLSFL